MLSIVNHGIGGSATPGFIKKVPVEDLLQKGVIGGELMLSVAILAVVLLAPAGIVAMQKVADPMLPLGE